MTYREDPEIAKKYKSKKWEKLRLLKKNISPFCERCLQEGIYTPGKIVHHKEYITDLNYEDDMVFFNIENLETLCQECHNKEHFGEKSKYIFDDNGDIVWR